MKQKKLLLLTVLCLMFGMLSPVACAEESAKTEKTDLIDLQANAAVAASQIRHFWAEDENGNRPDWFGGAYFTTDRYIVCLTDLSYQEKIQETAGEYAQYVIFEEVRYDWNTLQEATLAMFAALYTEGLRQLLVGPRADLNKVEINVPSVFAKQVTELLCTTYSEMPVFYLAIF